MFKLFRFLKPYRAHITFIFALVFAQVMAELYLPTLMSDIVDTGIVKGDINYIWRIGGLMLLVTLGSIVCSMVAAFLSSTTAMGLGRILRGKLFRHVESFSLHEFDKVGTPSLITRNTNDITQIQMVTMITLRMMIMAPLMCVGGLIMALSKDKGLTWVLAVVLPILILVVALTTYKALPLFRSIQRKIDRINLVVRENLTGVRVIRAFNRIGHERKRFDDANLDLTETSIKVNKLMAYIMPIMMLLMNGTMIAIIWFGSHRVDLGTLEIGNMMAFLQYAMQIMFSLLMAAMMFIMIPRAQASAVRLNEVLAIAPEIMDAPVTQSPGSQRGFLEFRDVSFSYHGAEEPAVRNITFSASPGEITAIIGGTGSGKSTLINLILRFYDVGSGSVLVDGVDIREMSQAELRVRIGLVPQKAVLFTGTVADNIRYGKADASEAEVHHAAEVAQALDFIMEMPDGFNSRIEQSGTNVSGGQKQRLSIARALVRHPEIYVFDDSFSALDFKTDAKLRAALKKETAESTVLIVAQRVSTVMDADRIVVLDDGRIAGMGSHKELMRTCEVYREIVYSQLSEEEIA